MSRHCSSVKSVGYDLSFIAPLPQNLTPTRRVNNSPDQMSRDNNCLKFSKPCDGHALRAFFAGVILSESDFSHQAAADSLPLQDAFAVLFFVSIGMLFDPTILVRDPLAVLAVLLAILVGKSLAAFLIVLLFRYPVATALTVSASLAQI